MIEDDPLANIEFPEHEPAAEAELDPPVPGSLSLSIETTMDEPRCDASEPSWMSFDTALTLADPADHFGPPSSDEASWGAYEETYENSPWPVYVDELAEASEPPIDPDQSPAPEPRKTMRGRLSELVEDIVAWAQLAVRLDK